MSGANGSGANAPPCNLTAERVVLGYILLDHEKHIPSLVRLSADDFALE
jgi:replicative DNA helicase